MQQSLWILFCVCFHLSLRWTYNVLVLNSFNQSPRDDFNVMADRYCFIHWWFHLFNGETWHIYYSYVICPLLAICYNGKWLWFCYKIIYIFYGFKYFNNMIQNQFCSFTNIFMFTFTQIGSGRLVNNDNRKIKRQKEQIVIMINKEKSLKCFKNMFQFMPVVGTILHLKFLT